MIAIAILFVRVLCDCFKSRRRLEQRAPHRLQLRWADRALFIWLYRRCPRLLDAVTIVRPETVVRWHRMGFAAYWRWKSRVRGGRPRIGGLVGGGCGMTFNVTVRQHGSFFKQVTVDDRAAVKTLAEGFRMEFNLPIIFVGPCTFLPTGDAIFIEESLQICRPEPCVADGRIIAVAVPRNIPSIKRLHFDTSACLQEAFHPRQHHALAVAAEIARLNPVENTWQFMRNNWLSNRALKSDEDILDHCCFAWHKLIDVPWKIMSIGSRDWAYRS